MGENGKILTGEASSFMSILFLCFTSLCFQIDTWVQVTNHYLPFESETWFHNSLVEEKKKQTFICTNRKTKGYLGETTFKSFSLSLFCSLFCSLVAEKWVPIVEAPVNGLKLQLEKKKRECFSILGLELTTKTVLLDKYKHMSQPIAKVFFFFSHFPHGTKWISQCCKKFGYILVLIHVDIKPYTEKIP